MLALNTGAGKIHPATFCHPASCLTAQASLRSFIVSKIQRDA